MVRYVDYAAIFLLVRSTLALPRNFRARAAAGSCPAGQQQCANDGAMYCVSPSQYGLCNFGCMIPQPVAAGTHCTGTPGVIAMGDAGSSGSSPPAPAASSAAAAAPSIVAPSPPAASSAIFANPQSSAPPTSNPVAVPTQAPAANSSPVAPVASQAPAPPAVDPKPASSAAPAVVTPVAPAAPPSVQTTPQAQAPAPAQPTQPAKPASGSGQVDAGIIQQIMPKAAACSGGDHSDECRTADQAAPFINAAFSKYKIASKAAQAATLALQALESGEYKYNTPIVAVEGKGTRNMQSLAFNTKYATSLYGADKLQGLDGNGIRALVLGDADSFGSASWFLATQCPSVLTQFDSDPEGAWTAMHGPSCISTTMTDQRIAYWTAAKKALGVS
jgi:hypothetical protein